MADDFTVRVAGMEDARRVLAMIAQRSEAVAREAVGKAGALVERTAKHNVRVDAGRLRQSIHTVVNIVGDPVARVGTNLEYARYVEMGWPWAGRRKIKHPIRLRRGGIGWFAPLAKTSSGRRWLAEHGFVVGARSSLKTRRVTRPRWSRMPQGIIVADVPAPARPYLVPALQANREKIKALLARELKRAIQGGAR